MTAPRMVIPGAILFITRRCHRRRYGLAPGRPVNDILLYLLAIAGPKFGLRICCLCVMSNHYHAVVYDPHGRYPAFLQWVHSLIARALNAARGESDSFWSGESTHVATLADADAVIEKIAYSLANPVRAGAVPHGRDWPGIRTSPEQYGTSVTVRRPDVFFGIDSDLPEEASFELHVPPTHGDLSPDEFRNLVARRVGEVEAEARADRALRRLPFLGREACLNVDPQHRPEQPENRGPGSRPGDVIATDPTSATEARGLRATFLEAYATARAAWVKGDHDVIWPRGTWKMLHLHAARAGPPP